MTPVSTSTGNIPPCTTSSTILEVCSLIKLSGFRQGTKTEDETAVERGCLYSGKVELTVVKFVGKSVDVLVPDVRMPALPAFNVVM